MEKILFGKLQDGRHVFLYSLENQNRVKVNIINYGAAVTRLYAPGKDGKLSDVVLGYDSLEGYINDKFYLGSIVGRSCNRITNARFRLDGKDYQLAKNVGENHLHGGLKGFNKVLWDAEPLKTNSGESLKLTYISPDGEEGYPGTVSLVVIYSLTELNELEINYNGKTDKPTILNPTHHSYFNLSGDFNRTILDHELQINADKYTPTNNNQVPTGELVSVEGTPMNFRKPTQIGLRIDDDYEQLKFGNGYDHNWVLNNFNSGVRNIASLYHPQTGRLMEVYSDQPGVQFYSGNYLDGSIIAKDKMFYRKRTALCLETQHFPDSPNNPQFPPITLRPGEIYKQMTIYKFSIE